MRLGAAVFAWLSILVLGSLIVGIGRHIVHPEIPGTTEEGSTGPVASPAEPPSMEPQTANPQTGSGSIARPNDPAGLERVAPRPPLGALGQAQPPPNEPQEMELHQPVATAAGLFEAMGYKVALAGTEMVGPDETCTYEGRTWPCGTVARTAFRSFLRGRAVTCAVPPKPGSETITIDCHIGKEDIGAWLINNGWARATDSGPYADAGKKAQSEKKGIFGPPPEGL
jgi:endonuclease YncB( thermonuclease family)